MIKDITKIKQSILDLRKQISNLNEAYYLESISLIEDRDYDALVLKLKALEEQYPNVKDKDDDARSPTNTVGGGVARAFKAIEHSIPMLSLDNAFSKQDIIAFLDKIKKFLNLNPNSQISLTAEPKIDGVSLSLMYKKGHLQYAATRGDGLKGEDVTENAYVIPSIPKIIKCTQEALEVRGEVYISKQDFINLNSQQQALGEKSFANPRNAASGSLRQLNPNITKNRPLKFKAWGIGLARENNFQTLSDAFKCLKELGFVISFSETLCHSSQDIERYYGFMVEARHSLDYDIDGLVFKVNILNLQKRLGVVGKAPRWAIAYKFPAKTAISKVTNININIGRTGALTPVAVIEPVNIGGVLVNKASLHNFDEIFRKDIRVDDYLVVKRAGDVIPQIVEVLINKREASTSKPFLIPNTCPKCSSKLIIQQGVVSVKCSNNINCPGILVSKLKHFASKSAFNIEGLSEKQIQIFFDMGFIKYPYDLFHLYKFKQSILEVSGFGEKLFNNLIESISKATTITLERFIYALGIDQVGSKVSELLAGHYKNVSNMMISAVQSKDIEYDNLTQISGIGNSIASDIVQFFNNDHNIQLINKIIDVITIQDYSPKFNHANSKLKGLSIVFTGVLSNISRAEAKYIAEINGARVASSVSSATSFVVCGKDAGSKFKLAQNLGIKTLTEQEFLNKINSQ